MANQLGLFVAEDRGQGKRRSHGSTLAGAGQISSALQVYLINTPLQRIGVNLTFPEVIGMGVAVKAFQGSVVWTVAAQVGRNAIGLQES